MHRKRLPHLLIGLGITVLMAVLMNLGFSPFETLEQKLYDFRFKVRGAIPPPNNIVIAAIDEKSIARLGRWPWDRAALAQLVTRLKESEATVVAFDVIFCEEDRHDVRLSNAIGNAGNVILPIAFVFQQEYLPPAKAAVVQAALLPVEKNVSSRYDPISAPGMLAPVPGLMSKAASLGHINMFPDDDGTLRWETLGISHDGHIYPSLTVVAAAAYLGIPKEKITLDRDGLSLDERKIPTDPWLRSLINYYGPSQSFTHLSICDILDRKVGKKELNGKIVLIGATAVGIYDLRVTPFSPAMPGVEKHANVIAAILEHRSLSQVATVTDILILMCTGLFLTLILMRFRGWSAVISICFGLLLFSAAAHYLFVNHGLWINIAYPATAMLLIFIGTTAYNYAVEEKYARRIRAMFSSYVTQTIVNELINNPGMAKLGGERREITVLFSDIRDFTHFAEHHSPEQVVALLNEYLEAMTDVVMAYGGTLDKFIGDAIVAFWNAPLRQEGHARQAVSCALAMNKRLLKLQEKWSQEGKWVLEAGIGINTGDAVVGNIGAEGKKMDYTVIGDQVNLGARVESLTRKYDASILITEHTVAHLRADVEKGALRGVLIEGLERVIVKGKETPVTLYRVTASAEASPSIIVECQGVTPVRLDEK